MSGDDVSGSQAAPDPGPENPEEESDDEVVQQPIPFQMGVTPVAEELMNYRHGTKEQRSWNLKLKGQQIKFLRNLQNRDQNPVLGRGLHAVYVIDRWLDQLRANQRLRFTGTYRLRVDRAIKVTRTNEDGNGIYMNLI